MPRRRLGWRRASGRRRVALEALREAKRVRRFNTDELWRLAKVDRVANVMRPYLEALA